MKSLFSKLVFGSTRLVYVPPEESQWELPVWVQVESWSISLVARFLAELISCFFVRRF